MTISSDTDARTSVVGGAAAGQEVTFTFPIAVTSDLTVILRTTTTGAETSQTETTDYTVAIDGDDGGTVTMVASVPATQFIHLIRNTPNTQGLDLERGSSFNAENAEDAWDKLTKRVRELETEVNRCMRLPDTDDDSVSMVLPNEIDRASLFASFTATGAATATSLADASAISTSAFGESLVDAANAAAANILLGATIGTDVQAFDADLAAIAALGHTDGYFIVNNGTTWDRESPSTARSSLGATTVGTAMFIATSEAAGRTAINALETSDMLCYENTVLCYENEILTWET